MASRIPPRLTAWLPIAGMALLAALTFWALQSSLRPQSETKDNGPGHTPDYFSDDMSVTMLDDAGMVKYRLNAAKMVHYEDDQNTHLISPAVRSFTPGAPTITATSKTGMVNSDGTIINLYQNARIVRPADAKDPAMQADSEHFLVLTNDDMIRTEKPVKLTRGQSVTTANGMIYTNTTRHMELLGQVRGLIAPSEMNGGASR